MKHAKKPTHLGLQEFTYCGRRVVPNFSVGTVANAVGHKDIVTSGTVVEGWLCSVCLAAIKRKELFDV